MTKAHVSDSSEQRAAESAMMAAAGTILAVEFAPARVHLPGGAYVDVDGVAPEPLTYVEAFARQGKPKGGQVHKIKGDTLKLVTLRNAQPEARLILLFASPEAARTAQTGWLGESVRTFGIEVLVVELDEAIRTQLLAAQQRQVMVNPSTQD